MFDRATVKVARTLGATTTEFSRAVLVTDLPVPSGTVPVITHSAAPRTGVDLSVDARGLTISARQWYRDGLPITGATGTTYTLLAGDAGKRIVCRCTVGGSPIDTPALYVPVTRTDATATLDMLDEDSLRQMMAHSAMDHVAIRSGDWGDPTTWDSGTVPAAEDSVLIPFGVEVTYDLTAAIRYDLIRVDGRMRWRRDVNTHLLCDTIFGDVGSKISVSDRLERRILAANTAVIEFRTDADISLARDPRLMSRGLISFGLFETFGASKTAFRRTAAGSAPMAGDTSVTLASAPTGWNVGDTILIPGTIMLDTGAPDYDLLPMAQDEIRVITAISGSTISFTAPLVHDHDHHNASVTRTDLQPAIAMLTRNIVFRSEGLDTAQRHRRGHIAVAREGDFNLWGAEIVSMGRTYKPPTSSGPDCPGEITEAGLFQEFGGTGELLLTPIDPVTLTADANIHRRDPISVYRTGWDAGNGQRRGKALHLVQLSVHESPGWAIVQTGCLARMWDLVVHDFGGAGIVAEHGDETGFWLRCYAASARNAPGNAFKVAEDGGAAVRLRNYFFSGGGMAFRGRAVKLVDCIVSGCEVGVVGWYRSILPGDGNPAGQTVELSDLLLGDSIEKLHYPLNHWKNIEVYGCALGSAISKPAPGQRHEAYSIFRDWKSWACRKSGFSVEYVGNYLVENITVIAPDLADNTLLEPGISISDNTAQVYLVNAVTEGWDTDIRFAGGLSPYPGGSGTVEQPRYGVFGHTSTNDPVVVVTEDPTVNITAYSATVPTLRNFPAVSNMTSSAIPNGSTNAVFTADVETSLTDFLAGGAFTLPFAWNTMTYFPAEILEWLERNGTWTVGGQRYAVFPRPYSDPLTGEITYAAHVTSLTLSSYPGEDYGSIAALPATPAHSAPPSLAYTVTSSAGVTIDFAADLLSQHAYDATGLFMMEGLYGGLDGVNEVRDLGNGTLLYRPFPGFTGTDEVRLFVWDRTGNIYRIPVTITVS